MNIHNKNIIIFSFLLLSTQLNCMLITRNKPLSWLSKKTHFTIADPYAKEISIADQVNKKVSYEELMEKYKDKVTIKKTIPLGQRYGTCHNYVFTALMNIPGKTPLLLNIQAQHDYYLKCGINILQFCKPITSPEEIEAQDIVIYADENNSSNPPLHTGIVYKKEYINSELHIYVESRWGTLREILIHPLHCVPSYYGKKHYFFKLIIPKANLLDAIYKRLEEPEVKTFYLLRKKLNQAILINQIKEYSTHANPQEFPTPIYKKLESAMDINLREANENNITPFMLAQQLNNKVLIELFSIYEQYN